MGNKAGIFEGQSSTPLSAQGQCQAAQLAAYLKPQAAPTSIYSSPLQRALETAKPLASVTGCSLQLDEALQELHQGIFQGLTWSEAQDRYPDLCAALVARLDYQPIPGAETLTAAHQRAMNWYHTMWQRHGPGDEVWLVTHGGFMQFLISAILGCDRSWQIPIDHTALFEFWLLSPQLSDPHNLEQWKIVKFNTTPHLKNDI